jgi:hypothetical protein
VTSAVAFQPFGYNFEIRSPMPRAKVKDAICARKKRWFDPKDGPRGWIVGPFICLWMSAFDRYGPMLFGRVSGDEFATRISGRAGSNLNGIAGLSLLLPLMFFATYMAVRENQWSTQQVVIVGIVGLLCLSAFWMSHKDRKHAEPLVRFLQQTITASGQSLRARTATAIIPPQVRMTVSGEEKQGAVTAEAIHDALLHAGVGDSVVLATGPETYMQTLLQDDGFVIEKREGDHLHHFKAVRQYGHFKGRDKFSFEETLAALIGYGSGSAVLDVVGWEPMELPQ